MRKTSLSEGLGHSRGQRLLSGNESTPRQEEEGHTGQTITQRGDLQNYKYRALQRPGAKPFLIELLNHSGCRSCVKARSTTCAGRAVKNVSLIETSA